MDVTALRAWLSEPRTELAEAVARCVREHVAALRSRGVDFYGYALLPGEPYDIRSLVAVANTEADIKVTPADKQYGYYRYSVDEWAHWDHNAFVPANEALAEANEQFAALHAKGGGYKMDEFEVAHSRSLLDAVLRGLESAKAAGAFGGGADPFLVVWVSDSDHPIMADSVRRLNPEAASREFLDEFG